MVMAEREPAGTKSDISGLKSQLQHVLGVSFGQTYLISWNPSFFICQWLHRVLMKLNSLCEVLHSSELLLFTSSINT